MAHTFSQTESNGLAEVLTYLNGAPEIPFDSTVIERVANIAVSAGFVTSNLEFAERAKDKPITTLLEFAAYLGAP